jgi:hypothetical protein
VRSPFSPIVMLSPIAENFFAAIDIPVSLTVNEQAAWRAMASFAAQLTVVAPSGKLAPETGEHVVVTGARPSVTVGVG